MAVDFRCERCGKLLRTDAEPGGDVKCPHCGKKVTVPAGLASLPRPRVPADAAARGPSPQPVPQAAGPEGEFEEPEGEAILGAMAKIMPWIISAFFHVGVFLIMFFVGMLFVGAQKDKPETFIPGLVYTDKPKAVYDPARESTEDAAARRTPTPSDQWSRQENSVPLDSAATDRQLEVIVNVGGGLSGGLAAHGLYGGSGTAPRGRFLGEGGNAHHVVFVIDRSGSMLETIDAVKEALRRSIGRLAPVQDFHVLFFVDVAPTENPPRRLVPAIEENKIEADEFLSDVVAQSTRGVTDPTEALRRAFQVLEKADKSKLGKMIFLLTDGLFADNEKVLNEIRKHNRDKDVVIYTYLYSADRNELAVDVLRQIAQESNGKFKYINPFE
jgi:DNA-directed RNA polymerase subunit RPC12/RpoP